MVEPTHLKNIWKSNWITCPGIRGEHIKMYETWNHHLVLPVTSNLNHQVLPSQLFSCCGEKLWSEPPSSFCNQPHDALWSLSAWHRFRAWRWVLELVPGEARSWAASFFGGGISSRGSSLEILATVEPKSLEVWFRWFFSGFQVQYTIEKSMAKLSLHIGLS